MDMISYWNKYFTLFYPNISLFDIIFCNMIYEPFISWLNGLSSSCLSIVRHNISSYYPDQFVLLALILVSSNLSQLHFSIEYWYQNECQSWPIVPMQPSWSHEQLYMWKNELYYAVNIVLKFKWLRLLMYNNIWTSL